jgi:hypothetical protein
MRPRPGAAAPAASGRATATTPWRRCWKWALRHAISPDLRLFADASGVKKTGGRARGEIYNAAVGVEWFPAKNVGVVLDYGLTDIDIHRDDSNARFRVKLKGPSAFLKVRF